MANRNDFQDQVKRLAQLISQFDQMPDNSQKATCKELVQLLMDVHGTGLEKMMEVIFENETGGPSILEKLGQDSTTSSLLLLYSLHPDDIEARVDKSVERIRPRLRKLSYDVDVVSVQDGVVEVRVWPIANGHSCGSTAKDLREAVEEGIYEFAPDLASLIIRGLEETGASGFVALESLIGNGSLAFNHLPLAPRTGEGN